MGGGGFLFQIENSSLYALVAITTFAGPEICLSWNRSIFTVSGEGDLGGVIYVHLHAVSTEAHFQCRMVLGHFTALFHHVPLYYRGPLTLRIQQHTSSIISPDNDDNCRLLARVDTDIIRCTFIWCRSVVHGPIFAYILGNSPSFQIPINVYWNTVYAIRNNIRPVRIVLGSDHAVLAVENIFDRSIVDYERVLTLNDGMLVHLPDGVETLFYMSSIVELSYVWASLRSLTATITQMGNGSDVRFSLGGIGVIGYRFL